MPGTNYRRSLPAGCHATFARSVLMTQRTHATLEKVVPYTELYRSGLHPASHPGSSTPLFCGASRHNEGTCSRASLIRFKLHLVLPHHLSELNHAPLTENTQNDISPVAESLAHNLTDYHCSRLPLLSSPPAPSPTPPVFFTPSCCPGRIPARHQHVQPVRFSMHICAVFRWIFSFRRLLISIPSNQSSQRPSNDVPRESFWPTRSAFSLTPTSDRHFCCNLHSENNQFPLSHHIRT